LKFGDSRTLISSLDGIIYEARKLYGFGGTYFHILENYIQTEIRRRKIKYPDKVWVFTDGFGTDIQLEYPERWYWFLTKINNRSCIPNKCTIDSLSNYGIDV